MNIMDEEALKARKDAMQVAREYQNTLTKPQGALGRLEDIAVFFAGWQQSKFPTINKPACVVFAGNHGVASKGVSAFPADVTVQMVANFEQGGAAINQLCKVNGIELHVKALQLDQPTKDFSVEPAMDEATCNAMMQAGMDMVKNLHGQGVDLLLLGEMGIGNTSAAAAICYALYGQNAQDWVGRGTGVDEDRLAQKTALIEQAVTKHAVNREDGLKILQTFAGHEMAAIAGALMQARMLNLPVLLDGFVVCAAAAPLLTLHESGLAHCLVAHVSAEIGHKNLLEKLDKLPLLDLDMRLGEGSGAALAYAIIKGALATHNGMASFADSGVSEKSE